MTANSLSLEHDAILSRSAALAESLGAPVGTYAVIIRCKRVRDLGHRNLNSRAGPLKAQKDERLGQARAALEVSTGAELEGEADMTDASCTVLPFPTKRRRAYPNSGYRGLANLPEGVVRLRPPAEQRNLPRTAANLLPMVMLEDMTGPERHRLLRRIETFLDRSPGDEQILTAREILAALPWRIQDRDWRVTAARQ
jgi:hypothetical protein